MTTDAEREQALANRLGAALTETGEACIAVTLWEREACARILDAEVEKLRERASSPTALIGSISIYLSQIDALKAAATLIRRRPT